MERKSSYYKQFIAGNGNSQAGRDIVHNNLMPSLKINPKEIKLKAVVDHRYAVFVALALTIMGMTYILTASSNSSEVNPWSFAIVELFLLAIFMPSLTFMLEFLFTYIPWWHVKYEDGVLRLDGKDRHFYSEIWDMKYKTSRFGGAVLTIYAINEVKKIPYKVDIKFREDAKAKYVYDSFWDAQRIERFKNKQ